MNLFDKKYYHLILYSLIIFDSLILILFKYLLNGLNLLEFGFMNLGNLFNLFIFVFSILGLFLLKHKSKVKGESKLLLIFLLLGSIIISLVVGLILMIQFGESGFYLFGLPLKKFVIYTILLAKLFLQIIFVVLVWHLSFETKFITYLRAVFISAFSMVLIFIFSYLFIVRNINNKNIQNDTGKFDVSIVFGAAVWQKDQPSPLFRGRIQKSFELLSSGKVKMIQLTGGNAPGELSEAEAAKKYLLSLGVEPESILIEEESSTTAEQIRYIKSELVLKRNYNKIILISDSFHLNRVLEMCKFFNIEAKGVNSDYELNSGKLLYYRVRESIALLLFWFYAI